MEIEEVLNRFSRSNRRFSLILGGKCDKCLIKIEDSSIGYSISRIVSLNDLYENSSLLGILEDLEHKMEVLSGT